MDPQSPGNDPETLLHDAESALQSRNFLQAAGYFSKLVALRPNIHALREKLADCLYASGNYQQAAENYQECLFAHPDNQRLRFQLGCSRMESHHYAEASRCFSEVLQVDPRHARAACGLGVCLSHTGHPQQGVGQLERALELEPDNPVFLFNYGFMLLKLSRNEDSLAAFRKALEINPRCTDALYGLGNVLAQTGKPEEARDLYRSAIEIEPHYYAPYMAIGFTWQDTHPAKAVEFYKKALAIKSDADDALLRLAEALARGGETGEANRCFEQAIALNPDNPAHYFAYGSALCAQGRPADAVECYRYCLRLDPAHSRAMSNLLFTLHYLPGVQPADLFQLHCEWQQKFAPEAERPDYFAQPRDPAAPLRIGFVSGDLRQHSVSFFLEPLLAALDPREVTVTLYSNVKVPDDTTTRLRGFPVQWRDIRPLSDAAAAGAVQNDRQDILIDLAGHTADGRLGLFALRPAPVQATWLGYPDTTGLSCIDWRIVDDLTDPPGAEQLAREKLYRLPDGFLCYRPAPCTPELVEWLPSEVNGGITFASFNNFAKVSSECLILWRMALDSAPRSRLLLKSLGLNDQAAQEYNRGKMTEAGIDPDRVDFLGRSETTGGHLAVYNEVDIALDTWPYHGTTTTCEALWMGVPVVTLAGITHASRVGVSLLTRLNLEQMIARAPEDYGRITSELAADAVWRSAFRREARERMRASALMDEPGFARRFTAMLQTMWAEYASQPR